MWAKIWCLSWIILPPGGIQPRKCINFKFSKSKYQEGIVIDTKLVWAKIWWFYLELLATKEAYNWENALHEKRDFLYQWNLLKFQTWNIIDISVFLNIQIFHESKTCSKFEIYLCSTGFYFPWGLQLHGFNIWISGALHRANLWTENIFFQVYHVNYTMSANQSDWGNLTTYQHSK